MNFFSKHKPIVFILIAAILGGCGTSENAGGQQNAEARDSSVQQKLDLVTPLMNQSPMSSQALMAGDLCNSSIKRLQNQINDLEKFFGSLEKTPAANMNQLDDMVDMVIKICNLEK